MHEEGEKDETRLTCNRHTEQILQLKSGLLGLAEVGYLVYKCGNRPFQRKESSHCYYTTQG
jgi:hypothetical protein